MKINNFNKTLCEKEIIISSLKNKIHNLESFSKNSTEINGQLNLKLE